MHTPTIEQKQIADAFYGDLARFAKEEHVARAHRGAGAKYYGRFGRDVTDESAILAVAWSRLVEAGVTLAEIQSKDNPQAWLRRVVEHAAQHVVNKTTDRGRTISTGWDATLAHADASFVSGQPEGSTTRGPLDNIGNSESFASTIGNPEAETSYFEIEDALGREIERILGKVPGERQATIARLYYSGDFIDSPSIAAALEASVASIEKALQRARKGLLPEEVQSLTVWRNMNAPGGGTPWSLEGVESTLVEVLEGLGYRR